MKYFLPILLLCIGSSISCYAQPVDDATQPFSAGMALPNIYISSDSEGFSTQKIGAGFYPLYEHGDHYAGLGVTENHFTQNGWNRDGMLYNIVAHDITPRTGMGYNLDMGMNTQGGHQLITTDSSWDKRWSESTATELFINRDWVESQNSLTNGIYHTFTGGSVEQKIAERVTVIGMVGEQYFSDGNMRQHERARLIYDLMPDYGITLQGRFRTYQSSFSDVNGNYFNPDHYREEMVALGIRRHIQGWMVNATAGLGLQHVNTDPGTTTKLVEIGLTSPIVGKVFLRAHAGYSQAAGFNGPSYSTRYMQGELVIAY